MQTISFWVRAIWDHVPRLNALPTTNRGLGIIHPPPVSRLLTLSRASHLHSNNDCSSKPRPLSASISPCFYHPPNIYDASWAGNRPPVNRPSRFKGDRGPGVLLPSWTGNCTKVQLFPIPLPGFHWQCPDADPHIHSPGRTVNQRPKDNSKSRFPGVKRLPGWRRSERFLTLSRRRFSKSPNHKSSSTLVLSLRKILLIVSPVSPPRQGNPFRPPYLTYPASFPDEAPRSEFGEACP